MEGNLFGSRLQRIKKTLRQTYFRASAGLIIALNLIFWFVPYQSWCLRCGNYFDNILIGLIQAVVIYIGVNLVIRHEDVEQNLLLREIGQRLNRLTPNAPTPANPNPGTDPDANHRPEGSILVNFVLRKRHGHIFPKNSQ